METTTNRFTYLDNIRNILVYNVVLLHIIQMFAYPLSFWWSVIDKKGSSRFYELCLVAMDIYLMPCLLFIAALFIFPSLKKSTPLKYTGKRFLRLCVPVIVFLFCAGDLHYQILFKRLNPVSPDYMEIFLNFWRSYVTLPGIYLTSSQQTLHTVVFSFQHTWFLSLLFFMTLAVVLLSGLLKRKDDEPKKVAGKNRIIILQTVIFALVLGLVYAAAMINYVIHYIDISSWIILGKILEFHIGKIWLLIPLFLFGLYFYKKEWLARGDIGSWKMWLIMALIPLGLYVSLYHIGILPQLEQIIKIVDHNMQFDNKITMPAVNQSVQISFLFSWFILPAACIFLLMFFLSFAKRFFNKPNAITAFCSKHSINVYILHYAAVLILQSAFLNVPVPSMVKIMLIVLVAIPACLWLSYRLVYPYPKTAVGFFVVMKLMALAAGFTFYYFALLVLVVISFSGAVYEAAKYMVARKADAEAPRYLVS